MLRVTGKFGYSHMNKEEEKKRTVKFDLKTDVLPCIELMKIIAKEKSDIIDKMNIIDRWK